MFKHIRNAVLALVTHSKKNMVQERTLRGPSACPYFAPLKIYFKHPLKGSCVKNLEGVLLDSFCFMRNRSSSPSCLSRAPAGDSA